MYQEVRQKGYAFNMMVHCDESERVITYDDVLGMIQVHAACHFLCGVAICSKSLLLSLV